MLRTLNIIGCGNVGKALARRWTESGFFLVQDVLNRSLESAQDAVSFIGAGRAVSEAAALRPADVYLIGTGDNQIAAAAALLAQTGLPPGAIVFHCSGALDASPLAPLRSLGAAIASTHPIRSFADPGQVARDFAGTWCGVEGDAAALAVLEPAWTAIGARLVPVEPQFKVVYHAAAVFACNYLVTLLDIGREAYVKAGVPPEAALQLMEPLVRETVDNVFRLGPERALSGPIARGDTGTVLRQYRAVKAWDPRYGTLYKHLGKLTSRLAARRKRTDRKGSAS